MFLFIAVFRRGFYDEYFEVWKLSAYFPNTAGVIKFCPKICRLCIFASRTNVAPLIATEQKANTATDKVHIENRNPSLS